MEGQLDRSLSFEQKYQDTKKKVSARNNKLISTSWDAQVYVLKTSTIAVSLSTTELVVPVWRTQTNSNRNNIPIPSRGDSPTPSAKNCSSRSGTQEANFSQPPPAVWPPCPGTKIIITEKLTPKYRAIQSYFRGPKNRTITTKRISSTDGA